MECPRHVLMSVSASLHSPTALQTALCERYFSEDHCCEQTSSFHVSGTHAEQA